MKIHFPRRTTFFVLSNANIPFYVRAFLSKTVKRVTTCIAIGYDTIILGDK
jgi:hypothetical protein